MTAFVNIDIAETHKTSEEALAEQCAQRDYLRSVIAKLPDPAVYANSLPSSLAEPLIAAYRSGTALRVAREHVARLRPYGLVEFGGPHLTAFGSKVRKILMEDL